MLTQRSQEMELLDQSPCYFSAEEYREYQKKLFQINYLFGFCLDTVRLLKALPQESRLVDVGCGGGLFLLYLSKHFPSMHLLGIDISPEAIQVAQQALENRQKISPLTNVAFELQPQAELNLTKASVDVVLSTLVCHHLDDLALIDFLQRAQAAARQAVIINDAHRHWAAAWLYRLTSPLLFRNKFITHDGLISIRRSFTRADWQDLLHRADIKKYRLEWRMPFRWRVIIWK